MYNTNILEAKDLKKIYYGEYQLDNISFQLNEGDALAVLGTVCAGKTPLLECITGRKRSDSGSVTYEGKDIGSLNVSEWQKIVFVPADIIYYEQRTVQRLLERTISFYGKGDMKAAAKYCEKYNIPMKGKLLSLSSEQNRCVAAIHALLAEPKLLVLDELYSCLTEPVYLELLEDIERLRKKGTAVIYACEEYEQIRGYCDQYLMLQEGDCTAYDRIARNDIPARMVSVSITDNLHQESAQNKLLDVCRQIAKDNEIHMFGEKMCFPYKGDMTELSRILYEFRCTDYIVEQMTLEEEVLHSYERWSE